MKRLNRGHMIAKALWPELAFVIEGDFWDKYGIDAHLGKQTIQVKYDQRIAQSKNLWHELYEKSANSPHQPWRESPGHVDAYIFTTETQLYAYAYLVPIPILAEAEIGLPLRAISPNNGYRTSLGFLVPLSKLTVEVRHCLRDTILDKRTKSNLE